MEVAWTIGIYLIGAVLWAYYSYRQRADVTIEEEVRFYQISIWNAFLLWFVWAACISCIRLLLWWRAYKLWKHF